jgi:hypothetical protein
MNESNFDISTRRLILMPALITLAITLLRLVGEVNRWSPALFNRAAGGGGALIGIVWLVPILGVYFALRLRKAGRGPASRGRAIGHALAGVALFVVLATVAFRLTSAMAVRVVITNLAAALAAWVACRGWPALGRTTFAYGLAARIPVAIVMLVAMAANWGTHYELGAPGLPEMGLLPKWALIGLLPQLFFWIGFTVVVGGLFGSLALLFQRRNPLT